LLAFLWKLGDKINIYLLTSSVFLVAGAEVQTLIRIESMLKINGADHESAEYAS
jgi:hypothetical protein